MNISQAAKITGLSTKQIRDYEKNGLLPKTARTYSGYRIYSQEEINRLKFIFNARNVGFSLAQIAELLSLHDNPHRCSRDVKRITEKNTYHGINTENSRTEFNGVGVARIEFLL